MRILLLTAFINILSACQQHTSVPDDIPHAQAESIISEILIDQVIWSVKIPAQWNGTLLLHSRGWSPVAGQPTLAPAPVVDALLSKGYALAASNYGSGGWALDEAVPAQEAVVAEFSRRFDTPSQIIGIGYSMGGLVTTALAEMQNPVIDGGISFCSSMGGALGMMNMGLDGAFVFRSLIAPGSEIQLVDIDDDRLNAALVQDTIDELISSPAARARIALAGVFAGIPDWTQTDDSRPTARDYDAILEQIIRAFPSGVFLPRAEQEQRAGGNFSWNTGVNYTELLNRSGRREMIEQLYQSAGLNLSKDLEKLAVTTRIAADQQAVQYMRDNYTPFANPRVPLLGVQTFGDGITSPSLQRGYSALAAPVMMASLYVERAGHCTFDEHETISAIRYLEARLADGNWPRRSPPFEQFDPPPMLRPCFQDDICL